MRVAVVGAGVSGVTTASELAADGHRVVVFERRASLAAESSFAHAGLAAPGPLVPWTEPLWPGGWMHGWLRQREPSRLAWPVGSRTLRWLLRARASANPQAARARLLDFQRLAAFSWERMRALVGALRLGHERAEGGLVLFRTAADAARVQPWLAAVRELGLRIDAFDEEQCRAVEPGLNPDTTFFGGVHIPQAEVGNARQFALLLRDEAVRMGVEFRLGFEVRRIEPGSRPTLLWQAAGDADGMDGRKTKTAAETFDENFDAVVVCSGARAADLLAPHRLRLPLAGIQGWSITAPLRQHEAHPDHGPRSAVIDADERVVIGRIGNRMRVSGGVRLGGGRASAEPPAGLYRALNRWFPGAMQAGQVQRWVGTACSSPDGLPILGESGQAGIWLNLGHGHAGWSLSCGAARLIADGLSHRRGALDPSPYGMARFSR